MRERAMRIYEKFEISKGKLGPLGPCKLDIRPFTVFVGKQGTGKSLVAQLLYFFRALPALVQFDAARRRPDEPRAHEPKWIIRRIIDGLRSSNRSFANLTKPNATVLWEGTVGSSGRKKRNLALGLNIQYKTRQIQPRATLIDEVVAARKTSTKSLHGGLFVPSERVLYSLALGPASLQVIGAPLVLEVFTTWMEEAGRIQADWTRHQPDTKEGKWIHTRMRKALSGSAVRKGASWKWSFREGKTERSIDLDMASSGQRANWSLALLPQVLFTLRSRGELAEPFTVFVEEPEIHLHPGAERTVIETLAYLVGQGFRVVVTTHSLVSLYTLNNLMQASKLPASSTHWNKEIPADIRMSPESVAAYHLHDGRISNLVEQENDLIDEEALGSIADDLASQMNRLYASTENEA